MIDISNRDGGIARRPIFGLANYLPSPYLHFYKSFFLSDFSYLSLQTLEL